MTNILSNVLESSGFRTGTSHERKVMEAARLFADGHSGRSHTSKALLMEAFTTSDFPALLGSAFEFEARAAFREVEDETASVARREQVIDFRPKRLTELFGETYFEEVGETEEYKADNPFKDTTIEFQVSKWGRVYGLSWERWMTGDFSNLADFPGVIGRGAANTRNREVYQHLVDDGGLNAAFFSETVTAGLGFQSLKDAKQHVIEADNRRGDGQVDASTLVLVVPQSLEDTARGLVESRRVTETFDDGAGTIREIERTNTLAGIQIQVSHEFGRQLSTDIRHSAWALLPGAATQNPSLILANLAGHPDVDIRTKRDQGDRVGGGSVGVEEGSFDNDTIWYRGRSVLGTSAAYTEGSYGSTGAA